MTESLEREIRKAVQMPRFGKRLSTGKMIVEHPPEIPLVVIFFQDVLNLFEEEVLRTFTEVLTSFSCFFF